jgi:hypothetical protein
MHPENGAVGTFLSFSLFPGHHEMSSKEGKKNRKH